MPGLPDLAIVADAFHTALSGRGLARATAEAPLAVRGTPAELATLAGQTLAGVRRTGKFLTFDPGLDRVVVNAMLSGRFQLAVPGTRFPSRTAFVMAFGPQRAGDVPRDAASR